MKRLARITSLVVLVIMWNMVISVQKVLAASKALNLENLEDPQVAPMPSMVTLFLKLVISLVIIVGLAYLTMKILRKNMKVLSRGTTINVLDQYAFSLNKGIYVTEIAGKVYALGVTDHNINLITEITDKEKIEEIIARARERDLEPVIPPGIIERFIPSLKHQPASTQQSFNKHIQNQIKKLQTIVKNDDSISREDDRNG